ncbi:E3 ISG15--protein ligase HERC5, partial [Plecturocebus cupreus]
MLKKLHRINQMKCQLPEKVCRRYLRKMTADTSENVECFFIFSHSPFIFNNLSKIKLCTDTLLKIQGEKHKAYLRLAAIEEESEFALLPTFNLTVRRNRLIADVLNQLSQFENEDLMKEIILLWGSTWTFPVQLHCCQPPFPTGTVEETFGPNAVIGRLKRTQFQFGK